MQKYGAHGLLCKVDHFAPQKNRLLLVSDLPPPNGENRWARDGNAWMSFTKPRMHILAIFFQSGSNIL